MPWPDPKPTTPVRPVTRVQQLGKAGSQAASLLQEMKQKQEYRDRRRKLKQELEALVTSGQVDLGRMNDIQAQLVAIEGFLVQADGAQAIQPEPDVMVSPICAQEYLDSANLYVGSLAPQWTEELMSREFGRFGHIMSIKIMYPRTGLQMVRGMSTGFVQFATRQQAEKAKSTMSGREYFGMALRIEFARPVAPGPTLGAIPAVRPYVSSGASPLPAPSGQELIGSLALVAPAPGVPGAPERRRSRFDMAKAFTVSLPSDRSVKRLVDFTAQFVAMEGWEFEKLLIDRESGNPRFAFLSVEKDNLEDPLHLYYRWRTLSFLQGDTLDQWRVEPFQIYENGPVWQPPRAEPNEQTLEPRLPGRTAVHRIDMIRSKSSGAAGSAELSAEDSGVLDKLLSEGLTPSRTSILEAMTFCLDNAQSSQAIAYRICNSVIEPPAALTIAHVCVRLYLLNDVLFNARCSRPGASTYRRQFQEHLPDVFERLRELCDSGSPIAVASFRERVFLLLRTWTEWSSFPRQFMRGLESTLCHHSRQGAVEQLRGRWDTVKELSTIERACRFRGLSTKGGLRQLVDRLCHYEVYWGEDTAPQLELNPLVLPAPDPEFDGEALDDDDEQDLGVVGSAGAPTNTPRPTASASSSDAPSARGMGDVGCGSVGSLRGGHSTHKNGSGLGGVGIAGTLGGGLATCFFEALATQRVVELSAVAAKEAPLQVIVPEAPVVEPLTTVAVSKRRKGMKAVGANSLTEKARKIADVVPASAVSVQLSLPVPAEPLSSSSSSCSSASSPKRKTRSSSNKRRKEKSLKTQKKALKTSSKVPSRSPVEKSAKGRESKRKEVRKSHRSRSRTSHKKGREKCRRQSRSRGRKRR